MVLAAIFFAGHAACCCNMMILPLVIGGVCIVTSIIGTYFVRLGASQSIMGALYKGFIATARAVARRRSRWSIHLVLPIGFGTPC